MVGILATGITEHVAVVVATKRFVLPRVAALQQAPIRLAVTHQVISLPQRFDWLCLRARIAVVTGRGRHIDLAGARTVVVQPFTAAEFARIDYSPIKRVVR